MAADILTTLATWSTTEGSNLPIGSTAISTNLDDNLRMIQSVVRYTMASDTIASATTTDLGTKESQYLTVSGTTTITGLGTISAGITKQGQRATGSVGNKDDLVNAGAVWADEAAFREGNQVWGRVVADIPDFNRELVKALVEG